MLCVEQLSPSTVSYVCTALLACFIVLILSWYSSPKRYFLDSKEDDERYFRIDEISGTIRTTQPLDREETTWHNITVMASEVGRYPEFSTTQCPLVCFSVAVFYVIIIS